MELTLICGMFNMVNRINDSLKLTLEGQPEIDKIRGTLRIDPVKIKNYLRWLADSWPEDFDDLNERVSAAGQNQKS